MSEVPETSSIPIELSKGRRPFRGDVALLLFLTLLGCYAYFWQFRGWNEAARLMMTYALGDRGTIHIDGLQKQSGDISFYEGHYYSCKAPGQSLVGVPFYLPLKLTGVSHPLDAPPIAYWWPDYVLTLATSGLLTAGLGVLIYWMALRLGCSQAVAVGVALCYGLATPALPYATLYAGHQTAAFMAFAALAVLLRCADEGRWSLGWMLAAGLLAGFAVVTEYTLLFASCALFGFALWKGCPLTRLVPFLMGAGICAVGLGVYHTVAFGGPFQTGYVYSVEPQFKEIYTAENPIGLTMPTIERAWKILFSSHGLVWYAPVVLLAPVGLVSLIKRGETKLAGVVIVCVGSVFLINAAHPMWWAGWSTGPRYIFVTLPFLMVLVAASVSGAARWPEWVLGILGLAGLVVCMAATAIPAGGRVPDLDIEGDGDPPLNVVYRDASAGRFGRNLGNVLLYGQWEHRREGNWLALLPLLTFWELMLLIFLCRLVKPDDTGNSAVIQHTDP